MRGSHGYYPGVGGLRIHYRCWEVLEPRARIAVVHGLGEHSGRYSALAHDFARAGFSTYSLDCRGHGRSDGRRGHVRGFDQLVQDLERFRRLISGLAPGEVPLLLLGHSLGGLVVLRYLQEYPAVPVAGAVLSSPLLTLSRTVPRWKARLALWVRRVTPALPITNVIDPDRLTHGADVSRAFRRDPMVHDRMTVNLYWETLQAIATVRRRAPRIAAALLFLLGEDDALADLGASLEFAYSLPSTVRVQVQVYPGQYHDVLNETLRPAAISDTLGWMERRISEDARSRVS